MTKLLQKLAVRILEGKSLEGVINKATKENIRNEVKYLNRWYYSLAKDGRDLGWTSGIYYCPSQYSKETRNLIRNKSLEIFLKSHSECKVLEIESGLGYEKYNVLIKINRVDK